MKTVLLIEDNPDMRENTVEILELARYKVLAAANGKEGVKMAQESKPDLIICDIMMPELDGYGVLRVLGGNPDTRQIPFIFLTAKAEKIDFRKAMNMGADDYITKPFDDTELLDAIEMRLKKNEILKKEYSQDISGLNQFMDEVKGFEELNKLSADRKIKAYKKKEIVFSEGNYPNGIYFINKGKVKAYKSNEDGKEYITGLYKEGDYIGYLPLLENNIYNESAQALEDSEICLVPKDDFFALVYNNRDVATKFIRMLSNNLMEKEERLLKLAYNSVRKRVAEALVLLSDKYKAADKDFSMAITREDLAGLVGTATETVIRTLSDLKEEKLIEIKGSNISILNYDRLQKLKN